jgi:hypothetical protein
MADEKLSMPKTLADEKRPWVGKAYQIPGMPPRLRALMMADREFFLQRIAIAAKKHGVRVLFKDGTIINEDGPIQRPERTT